MAIDACDVERYSDGTVLVRVHSCDRNGRKLPDAVFTFALAIPNIPIGHLVPYQWKLGPNRA